MNWYCCRGTRCSRRRAALSDTIGFRKMPATIIPAKTMAILAIITVRPTERFAVAAPDGGGGMESQDNSIAAPHGSKMEGDPLQADAAA